MFKGLFGQNNNEEIKVYTKEELNADIGFVLKNIGNLIENFEKLSIDGEHKKTFNDFYNSFKDHIKICMAKSEVDEIVEYNTNLKKGEQIHYAICNVEDIFIHFYNFTTSINLIDKIENIIIYYLFEIYKKQLNTKIIELRKEPRKFVFFDDFYFNKNIKFSTIDLENNEKISEPNIEKFKNIFKNKGLNGLTEELSNYSKQFLKSGLDNNKITNIDGDQLLSLTFLSDIFVNKINKDFTGKGVQKIQIDFNDYLRGRFFYISEIFIPIDKENKIRNGIIFSNIQNIFFRFGLNNFSESKNSKFGQIFNNYTAENLVKSVYLISNSDYNKIIPIIQSSSQNINIWKQQGSISNEVQTDENINQSSELFEEFKNEVILPAIRLGVTDIHIKTFKEQGVINYRYSNRKINLSKKITYEKLKRYYLILIEKSGLDNTGAFLKPQDGKLAGDEMFIVDPVNQNQYKVECRINLGQGGDKIYMRISGNSLSPISSNLILSNNETEKKIKTLKELGYLESDIEEMNRICSFSPNGLILVTGATGQGKSTLLFTLLNDLLRVRPDVHCLTIEDPIEMKIDLFNVEQNELKDASDYATFIKAFLRQDPDWIMVGETRDSETLFYLKEASLTGHLCFSTFHSNDTLTTIKRLINLSTKSPGEAYAVLTDVLSYLKGIISQKLIPTNCPHCKISARGDEIATLLLKKGYKQDKIKSYFSSHPTATFFKVNEAGCEHCNYSGYSKRRQVLTEILPFIDEANIEAVLKGETPPGLVTLFEKGLIYVAKGEIDLYKLVGEA